MLRNIKDNIYKKQHSSLNHNLMIDEITQLLNTSGNKKISPKILKNFYFLMTLTEEHFRKYSHVFLFLIAQTLRHKKETIIKKYMLLYKWCCSHFEYNFFLHSSTLLCLKEKWYRIMWNVSIILILAALVWWWCWWLLLSCSLYFMFLFLFFWINKRRIK